MSHPLSDLLHRAADGEFPAADGAVTILPALDGGLECSFAFTGHAVIATNLSAADVLRQGPDGFGGSFAPDFLRWLAGPEGNIGVIDATLVARGHGGPPELPRRHDADHHPRVQYARSIRSDVRVYGDARGLVTLADGLAGRREISIELEAGSHGRGVGTSLLRDALSLIPADEPVFAAVSPGNARSLRAFLSVGFTPLGAEVVIRPARPGPPAAPSQG